MTPSGTGPFTFQWQIADPAAPGGWTDLSDGPLLRGGAPTCATIGGSTAATIVVGLACTSGENDVDGSSFRCIVTNACGSVTSNPATLSICPADFNCDSAVDGDDVIAFFTAWDAGSLAADFTGDGGVDGDDVIAFFGAWDSGC